MLITKEIEVCPTGKLIKHLRKLNYEIEPFKNIVIKVEDLPRNTRKNVIVKCDICKKEYEISYKNYLSSIENGGYLSCKDCKHKKYKKTCLDKYGVENVSQIKEVKEKKKETFIDNYGTNNLSEIYKDIIYEKYGVENVFQNKEVKEKIKETNLERYGVENPQQNKEIRERTERTNLERYGVRKPLMNDDIKIKLKETQKKKIKENYNDLNIIKIDDEMNIFIKCDKGHIYKTRTSTLYDRLHSETILCTKCNPMNSYSTSGKEKELIEFIKENYNKEILLNDRNIIKPYEIDIFLPELNIAFEFNGVYWHNELYKDKDYHFNKYNECKKQSIFLFQIYEDDWIYKKDIVKSMILNKIKKTKNKIYARKTEVKEINDNKLIRKFLDTNHIQGFSSSSIKIGLFFDDKLVSLMTFKKKNNDFELNRFCNLLNTNVIGGASKLLSYFINQYKFDIITTFSNNNYSDGSLYKTLNFKYLYDLKPDYSYVIKDKRKHKFNFRGTNEKKRMLENKIYRIYDAGKIKFHFTKKIK